MRCGWASADHRRARRGDAPARRRRGAGYDSVRDLWLRSAASSAAALERLADADAFRSLGLDRREALWAVRGLDRVGDQDDLPLFAPSRPTRDSRARRQAAADAARRACGRGLPPSVAVAESPSGRLHARAARRARRQALRRAGDDVKSGERVTVAGLVLVRQRPGTAKGVIFMTLEDETGVANVIVWPKVFERLRAIVIGARFVAATGKLQNEAGRHPPDRRTHGGSDADARAALRRGPRPSKRSSPADEVAPPSARPCRRSARATASRKFSSSATRASLPSPAEDPRDRARACRRDGIFTEAG